MKERSEKTKVMEPELVISRPPLLHQLPYIWLVCSDGDNNERQTFYNISDNQCYVRFVPELKNKFISWCNQGWLVATDKSTKDCYLLNILNMEKLQLPPLDIPLNKVHSCVFSMSPKTEMDTSCRIIIFEGLERKLMSCHFGDGEFVKQEHIISLGDVLIKAINFGGKLLALTGIYADVYLLDFSDPNNRSTQIIYGESISHMIIGKGRSWKYYMVESCGNLLLVTFSNFNHGEIVNISVFRAEFEYEEWEKVEDIGDRAIFIDERNTFSTPASEFGLKGNTIYWVEKHDVNLYAYDLEEKTISVSCPFPMAKFDSYVYWMSLPFST